MAKQVGGFTLNGRGWVRWYCGKTRYAGPARLTPDELEERWLAIKSSIDNGTPKALYRKPGQITLNDLADLWIDFVNFRLATGKPKPISARQVYNYKMEAKRFSKAIGGSILIDDISPEVFAKFVRSVSGQSAAAFDSIVARIRPMFRWAVEMEYLPRARFGPSFQRPARQEIRDARIARRRSFTAQEVAKLIDAASPTLKAMIGLGICGALNNSEVGTLERSMVDLDAGVIDFRRRKTGKVRRVIPLPAVVAGWLREYQRPAAAEPAYDVYFFLIERPSDRGSVGRKSAVGYPYSRMLVGGPSSPISKLFDRLMIAAGVREKGRTDGRAFAGLRTTFTNLAPPGYRDEVELLTGHAMGTVLLDHYLEDVGLDRLRIVVDHVWAQVEPHLKGQRQDAMLPVRREHCEGSD